MLHLFFKVNLGSPVALVIIMDSYQIHPEFVDRLRILTLPYRTGKTFLLPSAEASNGPNAHPRINCKVTKSQRAVLTWVHTNTWNHPLHRGGLLT